MNIIIDKNKTNFDIDDSLYNELTKEKNRLTEWFNSFDISYSLVESEFDECYHIPNGFKINENLEYSLGKIVWENFNEDFIPSFDFSVIGSENWEGGTLTLVIIMLNFPEMVESINKVREKLGGLNLETLIADDYTLYFMANYPFDNDTTCNDMVREKVVEYENRKGGELIELINYKIHE